MKGEVLSMIDQMQVFDAIYTLASRDGCGMALFGDCFEQARNFYRRTLIGSEFPAIYFEFPLLGEPKLDLLVGYGHVEQGARFQDGCGFGHQQMFDWFSGVCGRYQNLGCGMEHDLSTGKTDAAGVYLQYHKDHELVAPFLESIGEKERVDCWLDVTGRLGEGWKPSYVGLFPGRKGLPMRIGGYMNRGELSRCAGDPAYLRDQFLRAGFSAFDDFMIERCCEFMRFTTPMDYQFDIMPDGCLGDTFGLSLSLNEIRPRMARESMESGYCAGVMNALEAWGLVDERWKMLAGVPFARHVSYLRDDGSAGRLALSIRFNHAKVKFKGCKAQPAKFYLVCSARDLDYPGKDV